MIWDSYLRLGVFLLVLVSCAEKTVNGAEATKEELDKTVVEKTQATYEAVLRNDDKKAKLLYGRNYKKMPEAIQFALDLRFKNYEHALSVLSKTGKSPDEIQFWEKVLALKPSGKLGVAVCDVLKKTDGFPKVALPVSHEEELWLAELRHLTSQTNTKKVSELDRALEKIDCDTDEGKTTHVNSCWPLSEDQQNIFLTDAYFDNLHNLQRRDTRFVDENYRNFAKLNSYQRYVTPTYFLKLFYAIRATASPKKEHYLRRLGGVARDVRPENLVTRFIGDEILADESDKPLLNRLSLLMDANQLLDLSTGLSHELANCGITEPKRSENAKKSPPPTKSESPE